jgi:mRNA interferase YafQ
MLNPKYTKQFKKDLKRFENQKSTMIELQNVIKNLLNEQPLNRKYGDHALGGNWIHHRECYVKPDTLLIYSVNAKDKILKLERFGSHSELFS